MKRNEKMFSNREEVEQMWNDGFSIDEIANRYGVKVETAKTNFKIWGIDYESREEIKPIRIAQPKPFKAEKVKVGDKYMYDVTQFCVDCGGGSYGF